MSDPQPTSWRDMAAPLISLFASASTLVCCALPALLVTIGAGAAVAGLVSAAPWITALSKHKVWLFVGAGAMLVIAGIMRWRAKDAPCPIDPVQAALCTRLRKISAWIYYASVALYLVGFFFAFIAADLFYGA